MKKLKPFSLFLSFILVLMLSGCKRFKVYTETYFNYFDTVISITGYEKSQEVFLKNSQEIELMLDNYHKLYDIYNEYQGLNNICTINKKAGQIVNADQAIIDLVSYGIDIYEKTSGKTNIAMGAVLKLWHDFREEASYDQTKATIPSDIALKEAAKHSNINDIIINYENNTICLKDPQMMLDVGAIAKGYVAEKLAKYLISKGINSYILDLGGNIKLIGAKPNGESWRVGIRNPQGNTPIKVVSLVDYAVVTSGSYQRYFDLNGIRYHHIIDPATLMPKNDYLSVTIICKDSALADAFSTALFNLSIDDGKRLISNFNDIYVMWITNENKIIYSDGFTNFIIGGENSNE